MRKTEAVIGQGFKSGINHNKSELAASILEVREKAEKFIATLQGNI